MTMFSAPTPGEKNANALKKLNEENKFLLKRLQELYLENEEKSKSMLFLEQMTAQNRGKDEVEMQNLRG
jgi:hypothetical protein